MAPAETKLKPVVKLTLLLTLITCVIVIIFGSGLFNECNNGPNRLEVNFEENNQKTKNRHQDQKSLRDFREIIQKILAEAEEIQEFGRQISFNPNSSKSREMIADYARNVLPVNDLSYNIKILNDVIHEESKQELDNLHSIVQDHIKQLQNPQNCATAKKLVCRQVPACGLGCTFHHFGICMFIALGTSRTMILHFEESSYTGTKDVFQPISEKCQQASMSRAVEWKGEYLEESTPNDTKVITVSIKGAYFRDTRFSPYTIPKSLKEKLQNLHDDPNNWWIRQIMEYLTRLQPWVLKEIEDVKRKIGITHPYVGIHVRRTDKINENKYHQLEEYMAYVENWYNRYNKTSNANVSRKVYISSDETSIFEEAKTRHFGEFKLYKRARFPKYEFYQNPDNHLMGSIGRTSKKGLLMMVCNLKILSQSDYFVGTFSSNVGRLVMQLMHAQQDATFMIQSVDHQPLYYASHPRYHEAIEDHIAAQGEISLKIGDKINYIPHIETALYKGYGKNLRTEETGLYPLHKVKEVIITAPYPDL